MTEGGVGFPTTRLKYVTSLRRSRADSDHDQRPYVGLEQIEPFTGRLAGPPVVGGGESLSSSFERGDVLFGKLRPYLAKAWVAEFSGRCTTELLVMEPTTIEARFLRDVILSSPFIRAVDASTFGSKMPRAEWSYIGGIKVPCPPFDTQRAIANYVDRATERLDALVAETKRVFRLLGEKRQALITRAVSRGLKPSVPLRDSGIPSLGKMPGHWSRAQLRRFVRFITSGSRAWAKHYSDSGSLFVRIGNLTRDSLHLDLREAQYVTAPAGEEGERTRLRAGDLLFSITAYLGSVAIVPPNLERAYVNQHIALVRFSRVTGLDPEFAGYAALSGVGQSQLAGLGYGGTKTQLALDDIRELWLPVPPMPEQVAIVSHIEQELSNLDRLRTATARTLALLQERRAALLSAAVTGDLDVRK